MQLLRRITLLTTLPATWLARASIGLAPVKHGVTATALW